MPYKRKNSHNWWVSITDTSGKRVRCSSGTTNRKEAEALEAKFRLETYKVAKWGEQPARVYDEMMLLYLEATQSKRSHQRDLDAAKHLTSFFRGRVMNDLKGSAIRDYQHYRLSQISPKGPVKPATVNRETALLSSAINHARVDLDWDIPNPVVGRGLPEPEGRDRHLSLPQFRRLIEIARVKHPYLSDFIELAVQTGCRKQEILGLEWDRVDLNRALFYLQGEHTKSAKRRSVPINQTAKAVLIRRLSFRSENCPHSPWVFAHHDGERIKDLRRSFTTACSKAEIKDFRIHDLRHTCASLAISEGVPLAAIRDLLGHSSVTVTERYAHLKPEAVREAVNALDRLQSHSGHSSGEANANRNVVTLVKS